MLTTFAKTDGVAPPPTRLHLQLDRPAPLTILSPLVRALRACSNRVPQSSTKAPPQLLAISRETSRQPQSLEAVTFLTTAVDSNVRMTVVRTLTPSRSATPSPTLVASELPRASKPREPISTVPPPMLVISRSSSLMPPWLLLLVPPLLHPPLLSCSDKICISNTLHSTK